MRTDVQKRLRASREDFNRQQYKCGSRHGKTWAEERADYGDLVALAAAYEDAAEHLSPEGEAVEGCIDGIERTMEDVGYTRFFAEMLDDRHPSAAAVCGFCDAAIRVMEAV